MFEKNNDNENLGPGVRNIKLQCHALTPSFNFDTTLKVY